MTHVQAVLARADALKAAGRLYALHRAAADALVESLRHADGASEGDRAIMRGGPQPGIVLAVAARNPALARDALVPLVRLLASACEHLRMTDWVRMGLRVVFMLRCPLTSFECARRADRR